MSSIELRILRAPQESWTDETVVLIDGRDQLAQIGREEHSQLNTWIGLRPETALGIESELLPSTVPHDAFVARCHCGELGCGALVARITRRASQVIWDEFRSGSDAMSGERPLDTRPFVFDAEEYEAAVLGSPVSEKGWQPTTRKASGLVVDRVMPWKDEAHGLRFAGCLHLSDEAIVLKMMHKSPSGEDRAFLSRVMQLGKGESSEELAERAVQFCINGAFLTDDLVERKTY